MNLDGICPTRKMRPGRGRVGYDMCPQFIAGNAAVQVVINTKSDDDNPVTDFVS